MTVFKNLLRSKSNEHSKTLKASEIPATYFERLIVSDIDGDIDPSAIFEVKSDTGGFLMPRMADKGSITATNGLMVYDTTANKSFVYRDGNWDPLEDGTVKKITAGDGLNFAEITEEGIIGLPDIITAQTVSSPSSIEVDKHGRVKTLVAGPSVTKVISHKRDVQTVTGAADFTNVTWGTNDFIEITVKNSKSYMTDLHINLGIGSQDNNKKFIQGLFEYSDDGKTTWKTFGILPDSISPQTACHFGTVVNPANTDGLTLISYSTQALITTTAVPTDNKLYFRVKVRTDSTATKNNFIINGTKLTSSSNNMVVSSNFSVTVSENAV